MDVGSLLQEVLGAGTGAVPQSTRDQFHDVVQSAPADSLVHGLEAAFESDQTPEFGDMVAQLFGHASPDQKSGIVNRLLAGLGPAAMAVLSQLGLHGLAKEAGDAPNVTSDQAAQLTPGQVEQLATHAQDANPGIVQSMSRFYAQHPVLVKTLGAAAMAIVLGKLRNRHA